MRFWWVNQNQTFRHEVAGGYLWSPKRKQNGGRNPFYEFMREVAPGDLVFSFVDTRVAAVGMAASFAYEAPKPPEFGRAGYYWERIGWRVDVRYTRLGSSFRPSEWIEDLRPELPERYSPLLPDGRGVQSIYLTELPYGLALRLAKLAGPEIEHLIDQERTGDTAVPDTSGAGLVIWEDHLREQLDEDATLTETEREAIVLARRGQGVFKDRVGRFETCCRVTRVDRPEHLRASHCKPWRDSDNRERLDGENGLLLTPSIDHLFDRGFISFRGNGTLLISPVAHVGSLARMGVPVDEPANVGSFSKGQQAYLEYHRDEVFLQASVRR